MDYFSHGIWSYVFFNKIKKPYLAVVFGLMPDTVSWGVYLAYVLLTGQFQAGPPDPYVIPDWVFVLYNISHSLVVFAVVALVIYLVLKKFPIYIFAWPIAIVMDFLTHTRTYLATPFLWPVSDWTFPGISWGNHIFMKVNITLIVLALIYVYWKKRKKKR